MEATVGIVGAGIAGLTCARALDAEGVRVVVVEKSRGAGGRVSTRRDGEDRYDHGAPDVGHDPTLFPGIGIIFQHGPEAGLIPVPRMSALARALAQDVDLRPRWRAIAASATSIASAEETLNGLAAVVVTAPAPQAADLVAAASPGLAARARGVAFDPCWTLMARYAEPLALADVVAPRPFARAARESARPGRAPGERWVGHADVAWTREHLDDSPEDVATLLGEALAPGIAPERAQAHRWLYSQPSEPLGEPCLVDGRLVLAGDWCLGRTVGDAVASGRAAAAAVLS